MPTHSAIPTEYRDGETVTWDEVLPAYTSGGGVSVNYNFAGPERFTVTGTGSGTTWSFALPSGKLPGVYVWEKVGTASSITDQLATGQIINRPNLATVPSTSTAATMLAAAETAYTALCAQKVKSASVNGESYTYEDRATLLTEIQRLKATVQAEQDALKLQQGLATGRRILTRLSRW